MKIKILFILIMVLFLTACGNSLNYKQATHQWKSHKDVAKWLNNNFSFDKNRQQ